VEQGCKITVTQKLSEAHCDIHISETRVNNTFLIVAKPKKKYKKVDIFRQLNFLVPCTGKFYYVRIFNSPCRQDRLWGSYNLLANR
jgi:hypothetical protein